MVKHGGHLRARRKCKKLNTRASIFYIAQVFSHVRSGYCVQCNRRLSEGTYFLGRGGLGPKKAGNLNLNTKSYLIGGSQFFSKLFKKEFYDVAFHFSFYRLSFSFHFLWFSFAPASPYPRERSLCPCHPLSERAQSLSLPPPIRESAVFVPAIPSPSTNDL